MLMTAIKKLKRLYRVDLSGFDDEDKIYFCGWNDHKADKRKAHNFDKTEFYLGKKVADYCRANNISSLWSDIPRDERRLTNPWD